VQDDFFADESRPSDNLFHRSTIFHVSTVGGGGGDVPLSTEIIGTDRSLRDNEGAVR